VWTVAFLFHALNTTSAGGRFYDMCAKIFVEMPTARKKHRFAPQTNQDFSCIGVAVSNCVY
jgi:hypothetical protein